MKVSILLAFIGLIALFLLSGCDDKDITFNRESAFEEFKSKFETTEEKPADTRYMKSKGVIIYKANTPQSSKSDIIFGPGDINFNITN